MVRKLTTAELVALRPRPEQLKNLPRFPLYVLLDNIRSLENVGLIFRLCDAARVEKLYLCGITGHPRLPNDKRREGVIEHAERAIRKTAIQTLDFVPWEYKKSALRTVKTLKKKGIQVIGVELTDQSLNYLSVPYQFPVCFVFGHEREGIQEKVLSEVDLVVEIPIYGLGNSLNVATSAAVVLYESLRRLLSQKKLEGK
jgi:tRNA G18 (ribose-2'-O)-methylase SpoU